MTEKILERLKALTHDNPMVTDNYILRKDAIEIVKEVATEHNNGWIPCKVEMPKEHKKYLVTCKGIDIPQIRLFEGDWDSSAEVIAWQPLPAPYQKGE